MPLFAWCSSAPAPRCWSARILVSVMSTVRQAAAQLVTILTVGAQRWHCLQGASLACEAFQDQELRPAGSLLNVATASWVQIAMASRYQPRHLCGEIWPSQQSPPTLLPSAHSEHSLWTRHCFKYFTHIYLLALGAVGFWRTKPGI